MGRFFVVAKAPIESGRPSEIKKGFLQNLFKLRRGGSNSRPSGYEPDELPLLYFAMWGAKIAVQHIPAKQFIHLNLQSFQ